MSEGEGQIRRKCDSCGQWNTGRPKFCVHCDGYLDHRVRDEEKAARRKAVEQAQKQMEFEEKPKYLQVLIKIGRVVEAVYMAIIGAIAWFLFWMGG